MANVTGTYYAGSAFIGYGAELQIGQATGSPELFVAVADITIITPGDMTTGVLEKTHLRSPDRHREHLATLRDSGAFQFQGNYRPSHGSHTIAGGDGFSSTYNMVSLWRDVAECNFKIILLQLSPVITLSFRGVVTKYQIGAISLDSKVDFTAEITPLSAYTLPQRMANPERGEVALLVVRDVDGQTQTREYTLKLSMNAAVALQNRRKKTMQQIAAEVETLDFATIRDIAHMLLQKYHAKEIDTLEKAGDLIDDAGGLLKFFEAFRTVMEVNQGPPTEGSANPPTAQASSGVDSTLTLVEAG